MRRAAFGLVLLLSVGCQNIALKPWAYPTEVGQTFEAAGPLLEALAARRGRFVSLTARARFTLRTPNQELVADHAVVVRKDRALRLETLSPLGQPTAILVATDERVRWVDTAGGRHWDGPSSSQALERLVRVPLGLEEMVAILSGTLPPEDDVAPARLEQEPVGATYRLFIPGKSPAEWREVVVARRDLTIRSRTCFDANGRETLRVRNERFRVFNGYPMPMRVEVALPEREVFLTVEFRRMRVNQPLDPEIFDLPIPPGSQRITLE